MTRLLPVLAVLALVLVQPSVAEAQSGRPTVPDAPARVLTSSGPEYIWVYWDSPSEQDDRAPVTSYRIRYRPLGRSSWSYGASVQGDLDRTTTITGLRNRTTYEVQVAAVNRIGTGAWVSGKATPQAQPVPAPEPPPGQSVSHNVGSLNAWWHGRDIDGRLRGSYMRPQYCTGTMAFTVYWHGPDEARAADSWEAYITTRGHMGRVTHTFTRQPGQGNFWNMTGRAVMNGSSSLDVQIRGRYGNNYGEWSRKVGLYCREVPRVANITTAGGQEINEGDSFTFEIEFDKPMQLDTVLNVRLRRNAGSRPQFRGGLGEKTITVRRGQSSASLELRSIEDDILNFDREITLEILPGTGYRAGSSNAVSFRILDGSYVPELDMNDNPTGNIVFKEDADTVTVSLPRCGQSTSTLSDRVGLVETREDAGTIQVPIYTVAGGTDFEYSLSSVTNDFSASLHNDFGPTGVVHFMPHGETAFIGVQILDRDQVEDTEHFALALTATGLDFVRQYRYDCQYVQIIIYDDDTADTTIRIADGATAAFTDFQNRVARVTEGNTIKLQLKLENGGDCIVPFKIDTPITASGDVSVIDQSGFTTDGGTRSGLHLPPCNITDEMLVPTVLTSGNQGTKTVYFDVAPDTDERIFLEGGRRTVRYTVHIDDSEAMGQQVESEPLSDETAPQLLSASVDGSNLTLAYDEELDNSAPLSSGLFTVNVNGMPRSVLIVAVVQSNVLLHLSAPVEAGDAVTVSYTAPTDATTARVQDTSGNAAASFTGQVVTNTTAPVESRSNTPALGTPAIRGASQVGETLTLSTSDISDDDGLTTVSFAYQWLADDTAIPNADASTYTLTPSEQGKAIKVRVSFTDDEGNPETVTSAGTAAVAARPNTPAAGTPTINGTAQVGQRLTADTSGISDADGLTDVSFSYQWLADDRLIWGARDSSYTLVDADEDSVIKVRVRFTDDRGHTETLTSAATAAVAAAPPATPAFTASAIGVPASHDGASTFTFELRFSEAPVGGFSYKTLRDHAFTVTGGEVVKARRLERPANIRWEIHVLPDGDSTVTIVLPATTDCGAQGAICAPDGRMLSSDLEVSVPGPGG